MSGLTQVLLAIVAALSVAAITAMVVKIIKHVLRDRPMFVASLVAVFGKNAAEGSRAWRALKLARILRGLDDDKPSLPRGDLCSRFVLLGRPADTYRPLGTWHSARKLGFGTYWPHMFERFSNLCL